MATGVPARVHLALRTLSPGYFAMTMATGIVSIGLAHDHHVVLSGALLWLTVLSFVALCVLTGWRLVAWRSAFVEDFTHPIRGFGFYSFVAAADVLAVRIARHHHAVAVVLLVIAGVSWLARGYVVPWTTHLGNGEHPIVAAANGTWFMWAVGGQSISLAGGTLAGLDGGTLLPFVAVVAWALGLFLYVVDGVFVAMRLLAHDFTAADLTPPYWVAMGAAAISALAGNELASLPPGPFVDPVVEVARGSSLVLWAVASWLLPGLFAMGWWRHSRTTPASGASSSPSGCTRSPAIPSPTPSGCRGSTPSARPGSGSHWPAGCSASPACSATWSPRSCSPANGGARASAFLAPRVGVEPTSLVLIQSQAGPAGRPTGDRPPRLGPAWRGSTLARQTNRGMSAQG